MISPKEITPCALCGAKVSVVYCDGCGRPLCADCRHFDLWSYGCGHIDPKAFCQRCKDDISVNPWGGVREDD